MSEQIARLNEVSQLARQVWLTHLAFLAFVSVTLLSVQDGDFLVRSRTTELPLIGTSIPIRQFLVIAPVLGAVLYIYLHLYLSKLWRVFQKVPPNIGGVDLVDLVYSWPVNDLALDLKEGTQPHDMRMIRIRKCIAVLLVWLAAPGILVWFWWRGMVLHDLGVTLVGLTALFACVLAGFDSWNQACARLANRPTALAQHPVVATRLALVLLGVGLLVGGARTGMMPLHLDNLARFYPVFAATLDISGEELVDLPSGWQPPQISRGAFQEGWCKQRGLDLAVCSTADVTAHLNDQRREWCSRTRGSDFNCRDHFKKLDRKMWDDWVETRRVTLRGLPKLNLSGDDLRGAVADQTALVGARLHRADLSHAKLQWANMERIELLGARLYSIDAYYALLHSADLTRADARHANLESANLMNASLVGVRFSDANLRRASLVGANLSSADLRRADLVGADLEDAVLDGAIIAGADLRDATGLTQDQLKNTAGSPATLLPEGETGPLHAVSCWKDPPFYFDKLLGSRGFTAAERSELEAQFLCRAGKPSDRVGQTCPPDAARAQCAPLVTQSR